MSKLLVVLSLFLVSQSALADMSKLATLDLKCAVAGYPAVEIKSEKLGAVITIGRTMFSLERSLRAATEGGDPYIQHVDNNAYNILLEGRDLTTAFNQNLAVNGNVTASIQLFRGERFNREASYKAQCVGLISFK